MRVFKIIKPRYLPYQADVSTNSPELDETIVRFGFPIIVTFQVEVVEPSFAAKSVEKLIEKIAAQLFPRSHGVWMDEKIPIEEDAYPDDNPTTKDNNGSLDSFPPPTDDVTDSSGT